MQNLVIGFTGTRGGMTPIASARLAVLITALDPRVAHHGDCVGADAGFHAEVVDWVPDCRLVVHPGQVRGTGIGPAKFRAFCTSKNQITHSAKPALQRNKDIVDAIDVLIAAPSSNKEVLRSGTWATIRYARSVKRPIIMIYPDGSIDMWFPEDAQVPSLIKRQPASPRNPLSPVSARTGRGSLKGQIAGDVIDGEQLAELQKVLDNLQKSQVFTAKKEWGSFAELLKQKPLPGQE